MKDKTLVIFYVVDGSEWFKMVGMDYKSPPKWEDGRYMKLYSLDDTDFKERPLPNTPEEITDIWDHKDTIKGVNEKRYRLIGELDVLYIKKDFLKQFAVNRTLNRCITLNQEAGEEKFHLNGDNCNDGTGRSVFERNYSNDFGITSDLIVKNAGNDKFTQYRKTVSSGDAKDEYSLEDLCNGNNGGYYNNNFDISHEDSCKEGKRIGSRLKNFLCSSDLYSDSAFCSIQENFTSSTTEMMPDCINGNILQGDTGQGPFWNCDELYGNGKNRTGPQMIV